jgi:hypothetical protein
MRQRDRGTSTAVTTYIIVLLSLQTFLLTVALDALLAREPALAWVSAAMSAVLAGGAVLFYRWLREP